MIVMLVDVRIFFSFRSIITKSDGPSVANSSLIVNPSMLELSNRFKNLTKKYAVNLKSVIIIIPMISEASI